MKRSFIAQAWVFWGLTMAILTLVIRNPFYLLILLLIARIVNSVCGTSPPNVKINFWRLAAIILLGSVLFNLLMVNIGQTVLFSLPRHWWLIGGSKTVEAAIYGAINGLTLITLLAIFFAFNAIVPIYELIRLTPRSMANLGLIILIAVTFVPEILDHLQRIREAQAVRGHRLRSVRDWQPVVIPLLIGSFERSLDLAETMVSRGYGSISNSRNPVKMQMVMLIGLICTFSGWLLTFRSGFVGWIVLLVGVTITVVLLVWSGREVAHTRYRPSRWTLQDWLFISLTAVPLILVFLPLPLVESQTTFYSPYPQAELPSFDIIIGLALTFLASPAIVVELDSYADF
jgi:energy-coupling factor transport system permease protein